MDIDELLARGGAAPAAPAASAGPDIDELIARANPPAAVAPKLDRAALLSALTSTGVANQLPGARPTTAREVAGNVGSALTNTADAASFGLYSKGRNAVGGLVAPDTTRQAQQTEAGFEQEHPFAAGASRAAGYLTPWGAPARLGEAISGGVRTATEAAPALARRILSSRPVAGALTGGLASGAQTAAEGVVSGAPLEDVARETGKSALLGAGLGGAVGTAGSMAEKVLGSRGARARQLIEERGGGATVGVGSPGKGGVFSQELAGVPASDKGIGIAAKRGAQQIADTVEQQFQQQHGFGYREGPGAIKEAGRELRGARAESIQERRATALRYRDDVQAAENAVRTETAGRARQIITNIDHEHAVETSRPYRVLKEMIDSSPAASTPRDVTPIVTAMQDAAHDLETAPFVRSQLNEQLTILDRYRDPTTGAIMVPERQLNGLRRTLMRSAKIGMSDAPGEAMAPLRRAAFEAKGMVDEGPYKELNDLYAEGTAKREAARQAVGLGPKPPTNKAADERRLVGNLRRSIEDQTTIPGPLPPEANISGLRGLLAAPEAARARAMANIQTRLEAAEQRHGETLGRIGAATTSTEADRALLGLNPKIGTRKTDVNQIRLALQRAGDNTATGGGSPADLATFRAAHPELGAAIDLPELARARADLSFRLLPHHGGLMSRMAGATLGPAAALTAAAAGHGLPGIGTAAGILALQNIDPITGRLLYRPAQALAPAIQRLNPASVARLISAARQGTPRPQLEALGQQLGLPPEIAANIAQENGQPGGP